jgi:hypothetical protein
MMKRWLYDFLFEKVIIHAKYLNPVHFSYGLITQFTILKVEKGKVHLSTTVQSHFQSKETRTASTLAMAMLVAEHYGSRIKMRGM